MSNVRFEEQGPRVSEAEVAAFERRQAISLPPAYRGFLLMVNGGRPVPCGMRVPMPGGIVDWRLHYFFGLHWKEESCDLDWVAGLTKQTRPEGLIPIASDEAGNFFYLDVRAGHRGAVYFGPTPYDQGTVRPLLVSLDFDSFIRALYKFDDDDV